jgi:hypothetical protein
MKKLILSASPTIKSIALAASLAAFVSPAHSNPTPPPPVLTFSNFSFTSANTGALVDTSVFNYSNYYSHTYNYLDSSDTTFRNETTPAAVGVAGSVDIYKDITTVTTTKKESYYDDSASYRLQGNSANYAPGQWIKMTGTVAASQNTSVELSLNARGNYQTTSIPGIGEVNPALPSLFLGFESGLAAVTTSSYSNPEIIPNQYAVNYYNGYNMFIAAGASTSFSALVYTSGNVSLDQFLLSISSSTYDYQVIFSPKTDIQSTLFKSVAIPALPVPAVPLPAAAWLFMTGLMGLLYSGKKKAHGVGYGNGSLAIA